MKTELTPIERMQLEKLLRKAAAADKSWSTARREEDRPRAEQDRLAAEEAKTAERLAELQSALDRVTTELSAVVERRIAAYVYRDIVGTADDFTNAQGARALNQMVTSVREGLPKYVADGYGDDPQSLADCLRICMAVDFPTLFAPPEPAVDRAAVEQARLDAQRQHVSRAIIASGKLRRQEPLDDDDRKVLQLVDFNRKDRK